MFISPLEDICGNLNDTVKLECCLNQAVEKVEWFGGLNQLYPLSVMTTGRKRQHSYVIDHFSEKHVGTYACRYETAVTSCYLSLNGKYFSFYKKVQ